ncbi:unnamed protein product [Calicophoron daubneyi]|uniref:Kinesin-like protein n=1 Tax=Calicophoron daubneyi TaxID=300641 RepID=A0AAV2TBJ6_CALDB
MDIPASVVAAVRVRPLTAREESDHNATLAVEMPSPGVIRMMSRQRPVTTAARQFLFDHTFRSFDDTVFPKSNLSAPKGIPYADQAKVYQTIALPLLIRVLDGYNACLFAYGMTSSGKTYSITGPPDDPGIIPRIAEDLFDQIALRETPESCYSVDLSYYEIYNERIRDLLSYERKSQNGLSIREHPVTGPYVEGLCRIGVHSKTDIMGWLRTGSRQRTIASTSMNHQSSRSHTVFTLFVTRRTLAKYPFGDMIENVYNSQINIIDLAGSERQVSLDGLGDRINESCQINKSLFTLGKVISQLAQNSGMSHADALPVSEPRPLTRPRSDSQLTFLNCPMTARRPGYVSYRDSTLTWLLKDSLGGNSMTTMLATISPSSLHYDETLATLRYAKKAQAIVNKAVVNEDPQGRIIRHLLKEVKRLREQSAIRVEPGSPQSPEVERLRAILKQKESEIEELSRQLTRRTIGCEHFCDKRRNTQPTRSYQTSLESNGNQTSRAIQTENSSNDQLPLSALSTSRSTPVSRCPVPLVRTVGTSMSPEKSKSPIQAHLHTRDAEMNTLNCEGIQATEEIKDLKSKIKYLQTDKESSRRALSDAHTYIKELESRVLCLQNRATHNSLLAVNYSQAVDRLLSDQFKAAETIKTVLQALLQRTCELRTLADTLMCVECPSEEELKFFKPLQPSTVAPPDDDSFQVNGATFCKENKPPSNNSTTPL